MKLTKESIKHNASWKGYRLPQYDIDAVREATHKAPTWLHFGAGNLFRAFPAVLAQRLLTAGLTDTGIICCDGYDEELIDRCYRACDHLSLSVTLYSNGTINKEVVASVTESLKVSEDGARLRPHLGDGQVVGPRTGHPAAPQQRPAVDDDPAAADHRRSQLAGVAAAHGQPVDAPAVQQPGPDGAGRGQSDDRGTRQGSEDFT